MPVSAALMLKNGQMMSGHIGPRTSSVLYRVESEDHSGASLLGMGVMESSLPSLSSLQSSCLF